MKKAIDWDDLRVFLAAARTGRLSAAARKLALDHTTVSRRIAELEDALGARLVDRSPAGITLTRQGADLLAHAERIEAELLVVSQNLGGQATRLSGTVRLATPEAFGSWLVAANMDMFRAKHPEIELELIPESRTISLSKREADIVVSLQRPPRGRVFFRKLADYRLGLYASESYLAARGRPGSMEDLRGHDFVWYIDDLIQIPEFRYLDQVVSDAKVVFRSSSIIAQQNAVAAGLGMGLLHHFAARGDQRLVRIFPDVNVNRTYWSILHADYKQIPRVRAVLAFLEELVKANRQYLLAE
jgi:DNA-binding transcriptional LysR family regulator